MRNAVLATRLAVPRPRPDLVSRGRLMERLDKQVTQLRHRVARFDVADGVAVVAGRRQRPGSGSALPGSGPRQSVRCGDANVGPGPEPPPPQGLRGSGSGPPRLAGLPPVELVEAAAAGGCLDLAGVEPALETLDQLTDRTQLAAGGAHHDRRQHGRADGDGERQVEPVEQPGDRRRPVKGICTTGRWTRR